MVFMNFSRVQRFYATKEAPEYPRVGRSSFTIASMFKGFIRLAFDIQRFRVDRLLSCNCLFRGVRVVSRVTSSQGKLREEVYFKSSFVLLLFISIMARVMRILNNELFVYVDRSMISGNFHGLAISLFVFNFHLLCRVFVTQLRVNSRFICAEAWIFSFNLRFFLYIVFKDATGDKDEIRRSYWFSIFGCRYYRRQDIFSKDSARQFGRFFQGARDARNEDILYTFRDGESILCWNTIR